MKAISWLRFLRRRESPRSSPLAGALPRVRALREEREWEPVTPPGAVSHRAERVAEARKKVVYHPLPSERLPECPGRPGIATSLSVVLCVGLAIGATIWLVWFAPARVSRNAPAPHQMTYTLPGAPWFLTEDIALDKATKSISYAGLNTNEWKVTRTPAKQQTRAPDGSTDVFLLRYETANPNAGLLVFECADTNQPAVSVHVQLYFQQVTCSFSIPREAARAAR